jgi:hypothetical protein
MKRYRITRRADGAVICWVQPSKGDRYALLAAPADAWRAPFLAERPIYVGVRHSGADHLARSLLTDHLGPATTVMRRFSPPYLQAFSAQFFRGQDSLGSTITSVENDAWMVSWQAQQPVRRRHRPSR